jgi:hypothetical protein
LYVGVRWFEIGMLCFGGIALVVALGMLVPMFWDE